MSRRKNVNTHSQYFRLLQNSCLPKIQTHSSSKRYNPQSSPQKTAERIVKSQQFVYIDYGQQSGCRPMQKINPVKLDEQVQRIGNNYICNLKNLSERNQQTIQYLSKLKQSQELKEDVRKLLKDELNKSILKVNKRKNYRLDYQKFKQHQKLQFDPLKLRQLVQADHFQTLNYNIYQKQKRLIQKFGISNHYVSASPQPTQNKTKVLVRSRLPSLSYKTIEK